MLRRPLSCSPFSSLPSRWHCARQCSTISMLVVVAALVPRTGTRNNILFPRGIPFALTCIMVVHRVFASPVFGGWQAAGGLAVDWYVMVAVVVVGSVVSGSCTSRASLMLLSSYDLMCLFLPLL